MFDNADTPMKIFLAVLMFPVFFQKQLLDWTLGFRDDFYIMMAKRILLLLPAAAIIFACWLTVACLLTVIVRQHRRNYVSTLFVTWWDLFRAIFTFWSGFFAFFFYLAGWLLALVRLIIFGLWLSIQDIVLAPLRAMKGVGDIATQAGTPWIAVIMTMMWCALEAVVFTFVTTPLVLDTLTSVTGAELDEGTVQVFLYCMLLAFVVGSYAIVSTLESAVRSRNVRQIALIGLVEFVALIFEVLFLYREFVDALVPWFAQYAGPDFQMGIIPTLALAGVVWAGIRGMTWFLFAQAGTPTIMAIIQRTGLNSKGGGGGGGSFFSLKKGDHFAFIKDALDRIKEDIDWCHQKGEQVVSAFIMPPLQIIGALVNFCTMLISARHLFQLPFKSYKEMINADQLIGRIKEKE
jgi:hypothetical protein